MQAASGDEQVGSLSAPQLGGVPSLGCPPAWGLLGLCSHPHCCNSGPCSAWQPSEALSAVKGGRDRGYFRAQGSLGDSRGGEPCEQVSAWMGSSIAKGELVLGDLAEGWS